MKNWSYTLVTLFLLSSVPLHAVNESDYIEEIRYDKTCLSIAQKVFKDLKAGRTSEQIKWEDKFDLKKWDNVERASRLANAVDGYAQALITEKENRSKGGSFASYIKKENDKLREYIDVLFDNLTRLSEHYHPFENKLED